nr:MAG TPA: Methuselah N-terminus [Caudoviricetes sp.]DAN64076.1 MAG TPA: Methuselah N-terminus [Caudoviricetes sp.]
MFYIFNSRGISPKKWQCVRLCCRTDISISKLPTNGI